MGKLKVEDLDSVLQAVYEIGCEVEQAFSEAIKKDSGIERTVLNVTCGYEENFSKPIKGMVPKRLNPSELVEETVGYEREFRWRIHFGYTDNDNKINDCFSSAVDGVKEEGKPIIDRAQRIAGELQAIYKLPYTPQIYRDSELVA